MRLERRLRALEGDLAERTFHLRVVHRLLLEVEALLADLGAYLTPDAHAEVCALVERRLPPVIDGILRRGGWR